MAAAHWLEASYHFCGSI